MRLSNAIDSHLVKEGASNEIPDNDHSCHDSSCRHDVCVYCESADERCRCGDGEKTVALIKAEGPEKAYAEINKGGQFVDGEIYPIVQSLDGVNLANAINLKLVGKDMSEAQDVDGKYFVKDMTALVSKQASFWYDFKFANPVTKKIQVKICTAKS